MDALGRRFEAVVFDWDGTAVPDRAADAENVRQLVEELCQQGMEVVVVSGTHVDNIDGQLRARPRGPGSLHLCLNRGSEVFRVGPSGPELVYRQSATPGQESALDRAADLAVKRLTGLGLGVAIVSHRLNRRKIDLIPEPAWFDPPKARIADLAAAVQQRLESSGIPSLAEVVRLAEAAAIEAGLEGARVTTDVKHVEIGITDKSDSARWIFSHLSSVGIGPGMILIVGDELGPIGGVAGSDSLMLLPEAGRVTAVSVGVEPAGVSDGVILLGGGPTKFAELLGGQLRIRRDGAAPAMDSDPRWSIRFSGLDQFSEPQREALMTLADGCIGTSGVAALDRPGAGHLVVAAGIYRGKGARQELLHAPVWNTFGVPAEAGATLERSLDLRSGMLEQVVRTAAGTARVVQFSSLDRPGCAAMRVDAPGGVAYDGALLSRPLRHGGIDSGRSGDRHWMRVWSPSDGGVAAAASSREVKGSEVSHQQRMATYLRSRDGAPPAKAALGRLVEMEEAGFERLVSEHRRAWARRWEEAEVSIEGDPYLELGARFGMFHLIASAGDLDDAAVGARGLSGSAYRGHVFWDAEVFVLPFLVATHPAAARAMLEYRIRRLPAAIAAAGPAGRRGARFPWESAATGEDVTPQSATARNGRRVAIRTGQQEEHIVADIAWAACLYADWTGDEEFINGPGRRLLIETARYWASRVRVDRKGLGHIDHVVGPDEYHEGVNDNAFTNVMARWNLRRAAALAYPDASAPAATEAKAWLDIADRMVDGYDVSTGLYEQFDGFFALEPLIIRDAAPRRPIAADVLLGRDRVRGAQVIKQADVLMLHHLVPDEVAPASLLPNLNFYEPRTAHGSSLSPGIHASLFARAGLMDEATQALKLAASIDLEDVTRTTSGGLHLASMGSVWQALGFGMLGIRPLGTQLTLDPRIPPGWSALDMRIRFRGTAVRIRMEAGRLAVHADRRLTMALGAKQMFEVGPGSLALSQRSDHWEVT